MSYLIIIIVIAVVVGPVMWMMPSPKQRRAIETRQHALSLGLQIKVCDLPQTRRDTVRKEPEVQGVCYRLPLSLDRPVVFQQVFRVLRVESGHEVAGDEHKELISILVAALDNTPSYILSLELTAAGVACYWQEKGGADKVDEIKEILVELRNSLKTIEIDK